MMRTCELLKCKWLFWCLIPGLLFGIDLKKALAADPGIGPNTIEILSYQDPEYRFQIIPPEATPPSGFEQPEFDDSTFAVGDAAFGSRGHCPVQAAVQTLWPLESQLLVRRVVSIPAPTRVTNIRIMMAVDNDIIGVFFNGQQISGPIVHEECPILDDFRIDVPQSLVRSGDNLVAFLVLDRGVESFFDARILAERVKVLTLDDGVITANINGVPFIATVKGNWDLFDQGGMVGRVTVDFSNLPGDFHPYASSGLSWLSWSNSCTPAPTPTPTPTPTPPKPKPRKLLGICDSLNGWNYTLERENVFPDGNKIAMHFTVSRVSQDKVTMSGHWEGKYALGTDIVFIEQPLSEVLVSEAPGRIKGFYRYILVRSDGSRIPVDTSSVYTFTPLAGSNGLLDIPQKRVTTNAFFFDRAQSRLTVIGQSAMLTADESEVPQD